MLFVKSVDYDPVLQAGFNEWEPSLGWQDGDKDYTLYVGSVLICKDEDRPYHHTFILEVIPFRSGKKREEVHFSTIDNSEGIEFYQTKEYQDFIHTELPKRRYRIAARDLEKAILKALER